MIGSKFKTKKLSAENGIKTKQNDPLLNNPHEKINNHTSCQEALVLNLDIGNGKQEIIRVYEDDNPMMVAKKFCDARHFGKEICDFLATNIANNLEIALKERQEISSIQCSPSVQLNSDDENYFSSDKKKNVKWDNNRFSSPISQKNELQRVPENIQSKKFIENGKKKGEPKINRDKQSQETPEKTKYKGHNAKLGPNFELKKATNIQKNRKSLPEYEKNNSNSEKQEKKFDSLYEMKKNPADLYRLTEFVNEQITKANEKNPSVRSKSQENWRSKDNRSQKISNDAIWEKLYTDGIKKAEIKKNQNKMKNQNEKPKEEMELTFKPRINEISNRLSSILKEKRGATKTEDYLIERGKIVQEKKNQAKNNAETAKAEETFHPKINQISKKIMQEKSRNSPPGSIFEDLHLEWKAKASRSKERENKLNEHYTFKPKINENKPERNQLDFFERLEKSIHEKLSKQSKNNKDSDSDMTDPKTGQALFTPHVGRPPKNVIRDKSISESLYQEALHRNARMEIARGVNERSVQDLASKKMTNENSEAYAELRRKKRLEEIFHLLDYDNDGLVSAAKIEIRTLPSEILEIFSPLLCEMEELSLVLDLPTFIEAGEKLIMTLDAIDREKVLSVPKKKYVDPECTFKPKICKNSEKISSEVSKIYQGQKLEDILSQKKQQSSKRLAQKYPSKKISESLDKDQHSISNIRQKSYTQKQASFIAQKLI